jgi:hypothetical protein
VFLLCGPELVIRLVTDVLRMGIDVAAESRVILTWAITKGRRRGTLEERMNQTDKARGAARVTRGRVMTRAQPAGTLGGKHVPACG